MYKPDNITPPENLITEVEEMEEYLQDGYNVDSGYECSERAAQLAVMMARSGKMMADAKYHLDEITKSEIMKLLQQQLQNYLSTSTINKMIDVCCKDYNFLVNRITEANKGIKYQLELMRTFISQAKEQRKIDSWTSNPENKQNFQNND